MQNKSLNKNLFWIKPAQKWLKDRKGRQLQFDDIFHYKKIIIALTETAMLMKEIDVIKFE